jgi:hypothetical protein
METKNQSWYFDLREILKAKKPKEARKQSQFALHRRSSKKQSSLSQ